VVLGISPAPARRDLDAVPASGSGGAGTPTSGERQGAAACIHVGRRETGATKMFLTTGRSNTPARALYGTFTYQIVNSGHATYIGVRFEDSICAELSASPHVTICSMTASDRMILPRRWRARSGNTRSEDSSHALLQGTLADTLGRRCTVLLAPPAAGKSTELRRFVEAERGRASMISLGDGGNVELELGELVADLADRFPDASTTVTLVLDSLDESMLAATERAGLIKRTARRLAANMRLVIACRTAAWLPGVQHVLSEAFGTDVVLLDLLPLTDDDAVAYATAAGHDGRSFLRTVAAARALPLVKHPKELEWLFIAYASGAELPASQHELYEQAVRRQVAEQNRDRQEPLRPVDVTAMLYTAGRMAVLSLFTGRSTFALWDSSGSPNDLTLEDCAAPFSLEQPDDGRHMSCAAVLATSLFTGGTDGRLRFTHQTVAEYLAARYLTASGLRSTQLYGLLRGRGGQLAPQVQAVAAWLVALHPEQFAELLDDDPLAFIRSNVELTDPRYRQTLVQRLLHLADTNSLIDMPYRQLERLAYDGIEDVLRETLTDRRKSLEARYLTIQMIGRNRLVSLNEILLQVALSTGEPVALRNAAGRRSLELIPPTSTANPLAVLAQPDAAQHDRDEELLGVGLSALLLAGASPASLLPLLRAPSSSNFIGSYFMFLKENLPSAFEQPLNSAELCQALTWFAEATPDRAQRHQSATEELEDAILRAGLRQLDDPAVRTHVVQAVTARLRNMRELFHSTDAPTESIPDQHRQSMVLQLRQDLAEPHLPWWLRDWDLIGPDDFAWLAEVAANAPDVAEWEPWLRATYDVDRQDHRAVLEEHPTTDRADTTDPTTGTQTARHGEGGPSRRGHDRSRLTCSLLRIADRASR
jgi:hypothetical protein